MWIEWFKWSENLETQDFTKEQLQKLLQEVEKNINIKKLNEQLNWKKIPPKEIIEFTILNNWKIIQSEIRYTKEWFYYNWKKINYPINSISFNDSNIVVDIKNFFNQNFSYEQFYDKIIKI